LWITPRWQVEYREAGATWHDAVEYFLRNRPLASCWMDAEGSKTTPDPVRATLPFGLLSPGKKLRSSYDKRP